MLGRKAGCSHTGGYTKSQVSGLSAYHRGLPERPEGVPLESTFIESGKLRGPHNLVVEFFNEGAS